MKRTKQPSKQFTAPPDAWNCDPIPQSFTIVSNEIIKNPNLSFKTTGVLVYLLHSSYKKGWHTYIASLIKAKKDGKSAVSSALKELEQNGYLLRFKYYGKNKKIMGSSIAYTSIPFYFNLEETQKYMKEHNYKFIPSTKLSQEVYDFITKKLKPENLILGNLILENQPLLNNNIKKIIKKDITHPSSYGNISPSKQTKIDPNKVENLKLAKRLAEIISSIKKINCNSDVTKWANAFRLLKDKDLKINGTSNAQIKQRINAALCFYKQHAGEPYIPVIDSGNSFRSKFTKLEDAMKREQEQDFPIKKEKQDDYADEMFNRRGQNIY